MTNVLIRERGQFETKEKRHREEAAIMKVETGVK
jgi:hypothetical protein